MKVCFLTANHPPEAVGGTEQVVTALARELRRAGVSLATISGSERPMAGIEVEVDEHDGMPVHRLRRRADEYDGHGFHRPRLLGHIRALLQQLRPDLVHAHSFSAFGAGVAAICRELGMPLVITGHDLWLVCARFFRVPEGGVSCPSGTDRSPCVPCLNTSLPVAPGVIASGLAERDRLLRAEVEAAALCITPSATTAAMLREFLPYQRPIEVVPHGLLRAVAVADAAPAPRPGELLRIGSFGGIVAQKGLRELVCAAAGLPCELHLAGPAHEPAFDQELQALAARLGVRLVRRGVFTGADRHPARDLHLAVFPSKCQETYGLVVDEALAHRVPVVVSDAGALRERAGTGGVVVTPIGRLAEVLRELVGSRARLEALRAAIPSSLPTIAAAAARHLELYQRLR